MSVLTGQAKVGERVAHALFDALDAFLPADPYHADALIEAAVDRVLDVVEFDRDGNPRGHLFITGEGPNGFAYVECSVHGGIDVHMIVGEQAGPDRVATYVCGGCGTRRTVIQ